MVNYSPEITGATIEAEESLLGSILIESCRGTNEAIRKVSNILRPGDFYGCVESDRPERWVWRARMFYAMTLCDYPPHQIILARKMVDLNILENNDCSLMAHCIALVPCSLDYLEYANAVKEYSRLRQVKYYAGKGNLKKLSKLTNEVAMDEGIIL